MYKISASRHFKWLTTVLVVTLLLSAATAASACPIQLPATEVNVKGVQLKLEIAATPEARQCGLSQRLSLPDDQGMLFVVPKPKILSFWMANTQLQLSIAFLDDKGRILSIQKMKPEQTQERYRSPEPARYAIEVYQGWFVEHEIAVGDVVEMHLPTMLLVR